VYDGVFFRLENSASQRSSLRIEARGSRDFEAAFISSSFQERKRISSQFEMPRKTIAEFLGAFL
jgi:hypothetical protein